MITKKELINLSNKLENAVDRFILVGLFYGLSDADNRVQLLNIKKESVNFENSTITLPSGRVVIMDDFLKKIALEAINQEIYIKMGEQGRTNEDYYFNPSNEYILRPKPLKGNNNGIDPLTTGGFKTRIRAISTFLVGDTSITPSLLKISGVYEKLKSENKHWTIRGAESFLKENGLSIRRNNLIPILKK